MDSGWPLKLSSILCHVQQNSLQLLLIRYSKRWNFPCTPIRYSRRWNPSGTSHPIQQALKPSRYHHQIQQALEPSRYPPADTTGVVTPQVTPSDIAGAGIPQVPPSDTAGSGTLQVPSIIYSRRWNPPGTPHQIQQALGPHHFLCRSNLFTKYLSFRRNLFAIKLFTTPALKTRQRYFPF